MSVSFPYTALLNANKRKSEVFFGSSFPLESGKRGASADVLVSSEPVTWRQYLLRTAKKAHISLCPSFDIAMAGPLFPPLSMSLGARKHVGESASLQHFSPVPVNPILAEGPAPFARWCAQASGGRVVADLRLFWSSCSLRAHAGSLLSNALTREYD